MSHGSTHARCSTCAAELESCDCVGDGATHCLRAQGWMKAKHSSCRYCPRCCWGWAAPNVDHLHCRHWEPYLSWQERHRPDPVLGRVQPWRMRRRPTLVRRALGQVASAVTRTWRGTCLEYTMRGAGLHVPLRPVVFMKESGWGPSRMAVVAAPGPMEAPLKANSSTGRYTAKGLALGPAAESFLASGELESHTGKVRSSRRTGGLGSLEVAERAAPMMLQGRWAGPMMLHGRLLQIRGLRPPPRTLRLTGPSEAQRITGTISRHVVEVQAHPSPRLRRWCL